MRIGIAGLGLIGGSLARALAERLPCATRVGYDTCPRTIARAHSAGWIDRVAASSAELRDTCSLVVLCQPVTGVIESLHDAATDLRPPVMCDAASVKLPVLQAASQALGAQRGRFVGSHPIAGKAESGLAASDAELFEGRLAIVCPEGADAHAVALVKALWTVVGAHVTTMEARRHDAVYACVSHLPQLLTWTYLRTLAREPGRSDLPALAGPGFESFTRLGRSDPRLWAEIVLHNREPLLERLDRFERELDELRTALRSGRVNALSDLFEAARHGLAAAPALPSRAPNAIHERAFPTTPSPLEPP